MRSDVALQRFEFFAIFQADDMVWRNGLFDRNRGFELFDFRFIGVVDCLTKRAVHLLDQSGKIRGGNSVVGDV